MVWSTLCKLLQKQTYDVLSHRYGTYILTGGLILVIVSGFQFGEVALEWSQEKYAAVFNSFSDNVAGRSYQSRLCLPVPIDVVYTWVNGSDPKLLAELRNFRAEMEMELNETRSSSDSGTPRCPFTHCFLSLAVVMEPALPPGVDPEKLQASSSVLGRAVRTSELVAPPGDGGKNVSVFYFSRPEDAKAALEEAVTIEGHNYTLHAAYYTSDWTLANSVLLKDTILMTGFPHSLTAEQLLEKMPDKFAKANVQLRLYESEGMAVMEVPEGPDVDDLAHTTNFTIDGKEPTLNSAALIWDMQDVRYNEEIAASRFADNEELRYSLRSIQTFAPWVRHIYLVTNGQIPSWLNLDNPRLTVVTHQEIFPNSSHLPAFASPAIECHLHRIRGLSDKFIYMNDDVMFGKEVWPDDFFTHAHGQKVYLTWPVPNCQDGCPSSWIRDGYCDKACNNSECEWDGGDCAGGAPNTFGDHGMGPVGEWHADNQAMYCSSGCANNWVADRYCDQACNVKECGYDAGDCGVVNFDKLTRIDLKKDETDYVAPKGETVMYFNISAVFGDGVSLEEGDYSEDPALRTATLAQKFKTLTVILFEKQNASKLHFFIKGKLNSTEIEFSFNVSVDPTPDKKADLKAVDPVLGKAGTKPNHTASSSETGPVGPETKLSEPAFKFEDIPEELQQPRVVKEKLETTRAEVPKDLTEYELDQDTLSAWKLLLEEAEQGDITNKGFEIRKGIIWGEFLQKLRKEGKTPQRASPKELHNPDENEKDPDRPQPPVDEVGQKEPSVHEDTSPEKKTGEGPDGKKFDQYLQSKQLNRSKKENDPEKITLEKNKAPNSRVVEDVGRHDAPLEVKPLHRRVEEEELRARGELPRAMPPPGGQVRHMSQGRQPPPPGRERDHLQLPGGPPMEKVIVKHLDTLETEAQKRGVDRQEGVRKAPGGNQGVGNGGHKERRGAAGDARDGKVAATAHYTQSSSHKSRKLNAADGDLNDLPTWADPGDRLGFLPWEKQRVFASLQKRQERRQRREDYTVTGGGKRRRLLDTFGDSLRHVNRLYNTAYGYSARKVPAHMPHFIDRNIMYELQDKFPKEWDETSSHRIRSSRDMQFAFAYMYFMMSEPQPTTVGDIFDELDNDKSGVLSDRELRTMATRLYDLPLDLQTLTGLEQMLINCSKHLPAIATFTWGRQTETYYEKEMAQVTKTLINNCGPVIDLIQKNFKGRTKYKHEVVDDSEVAFKMIHTNVSQVVGQLDDIRRNPKKFICLNDNMDHSKEEAKTVKAVLLDFYESILPTPSDFELAREYRNRFLHTDELREWRKYRDWLKLWTQVALGVLILFTIGSFFADKFLSVRRRLFRPRAPSQHEDLPPRGEKAGSGGPDPAGGQPEGDGGGGSNTGRPPDLVDV